MILQGMVAATASGDSSWFFHFKLIAFQTLIDFEDRYGEDWPPLKSGVAAVLEKASARRYRRILPLALGNAARPAMREPTHD
jgi:hypothetical protein